MSQTASNSSARRHEAAYRRLRPALLLPGLLLATAVLILRPWREPVHAQPTTAAAVPVVAVVRVERADLFREITIPAEFRPYNEVDLHAKVAGYVRRMLVDIGDRVQAGQLLAELEVPELKDELDRAVATRSRAEAEYRDAHLAYTRLVAVNHQHPNLIAQQDLDSAEAKDATAQGALGAARADVSRYQTLWGYTRITAPFAGVITKRYADPGALIQAGTASQTMPLVRLSENQLLRLDYPVPVDYVRGIRVGAAVKVRVDSLGGRTLQGKITRCTARVDDSTRTMLVETEVPNPQLELVPGMYAQVSLNVEEHPNVLSVPVEAVPPGARSVLVVNSARRLEERPVKLGLETPARYEVVSGLREGELVVAGNPGQLVAGEPVRPQLTEPLARN